MYLLETMKMQTRNYVYISQGRNGRLSSESLPSNVHGLYTDNFTTCVIFLCTGSKRASMLHVDSLSIMDSTQITDEFDWAGEKISILMIYKEAGSMIADAIQGALGSRYKISPMLVEDAHYGVSILNSEKNFKVNIFPKVGKPESIYYHPQEKQCMAVRATEQIVGKPAFRVGYLPIKQQLVFNGRAWLTLSGIELQIDERHPLTKAEMDILRRESGNFHTLLNSICRDIVTFHSDNIFEKLYTFSMTVSCIEDYLSDFQLDADQTLKTNILESFNQLQSTEETASHEDIDFKNSMLALLNTAIDVALISQLLNTYETSAPETPYKEIITLYCKTFIIHHERRLFYKKLDADGVFLPPDVSNVAISSSATIISSSRAAFYQSPFANTDKVIIISYLKLITNIQEGWKGSADKGLIWLEYSDKNKVDEVSSLLNQNMCCEASVQFNAKTGIPTLMIKNINQEKLRAFSEISKRTSSATPFS